MEEIKKIEVQGQQYGVADMLMRSVMGGNAQVIEWSHTHNMNDYKDAGTYRIKGERTGNPLEDNLPIMNSGSGHTIEGILYVLDSSLTNGSGNSDDCTITQFLMLSNRVGGQEGDMYMRSAYGATKDSLTWKPWEKYQTNVEVGVMTDAYTVNPQNPTQIINHAYGMKDLADNGIYSGVYIGPKTMIGTTEDPNTIAFQDPTAIETFVMVVVNNYAAAKDAKCITQIKFAVTNGGVFSMEKRSTSLGGNIWSYTQWESVGGGSSLGEWDVDNGIFFIRNPSDTYKNITIGTGVRIAGDFVVSNNLHITSDRHCDLFIGTNMESTPNIYQTIIGKSVYLGNETTIESGVVIQQGCHFYAGSGGDYVSIGNENIPFKTNTKFFGEDNQIGCTDTSYEGLSKRIGGVKIGCNVVVPDNVQFSIADNILTITDGTNTWKLTAES